MTSALTKDRLNALLNEIRAVYRENDTPWVVGYSGGKDSTAALQLTWMAVAGLPEEERTRPVHVISTDTLVETPVIVNHVTGTLKRIETAAREQDMPVTTHLLKPRVPDSFWVNLIGKGYPAPTSIFRWCTDRLKIKPSNQFIQDQVSENGEVILVLGVRLGESTTRDQVIKMHRVPGKKLARHGQLPGAWVLMPIEEFSVDDVWRFLLQVSSPWGADNRQLANLYQSAQDGECPLVVDNLTSSCGNSRFGCWTCTVVERDRSMEAVIDNGETWLTPLLEFREFLASTQDPEKKAEQREYRGRDGRVKISKHGSLRYRTYTLDFAKTILRKLLQTQAEVQKHDPDFDLISEGELREIRRLWITERNDWDDSLPGIVEAETDLRLHWERDDIATPGRLEAEALTEAAEDHDVPVDLLRKLVDAEWQHHGMRRRSRIHKQIESILGQDWRSIEEVQAEADRKRAIAEGDGAVTEPPMLFAADAPADQDTEDSE